MTESKFQSICKNATQAFDSIDQLKSIVNSLKESNDYDLILDNQIIENVYNICQDYKQRSDLINKKQNIYLISRKVNKRKKFKTDSNENYYKNELKNMLNNEQLFGGTKDAIDKSIEWTKIDNNINFETLNNNINDLKHLKEKAVCLLKLMKLRSSQQANIPLDSTSHLNKLNELISVIEARRIKYDSEKKNLKASRDMENRINFKSKINRFESIIKENLFSSKNFSEFENFHNQAELSIDHLIAIRTEWDLYISNSTKAESIPILWVEPNSTPNDEWSQFLKLSN